MPLSTAAGISRQKPAWHINIDMVVSRWASPIPLKGSQPHGDAHDRDMRHVLVGALLAVIGAVCSSPVCAMQVVGSLQPQPSLPRGFTGAHCQVHINPNATSALAAAYSDSPLKRNRPPPLNQRAIFEVCPCAVDPLLSCAAHNS
jgi:hypothetical protein